MFERDDSPQAAWTPWRGPCPVCAVPLRIVPGKTGECCPACDCRLVVVRMEFDPSVAMPSGWEALKLVIEPV